MIPSETIPENLTVTEDASVSRTYRIYQDKIQGFAAEAEALKQTIYKLLNTEKYEYPIYSFDYGIELENLIGKDPTYVKIDLMRRIKECLLQDDRINSADNFVFTLSGDEMVCTFDITSIYGAMQITREVNY
ncbi:MAG: DUF2634 domain-containing protein [Anaerocolumna sp.]